MHTMRRSSVVVTTTPGLLPTEVAVAEGGDLGQGFMTRPLFTEPHRRRSRKMNGLGESPEYPRHLFLIVRPERVVRTLPKEPISSRWALRASSSGASKT